jgi:hypothetical protein
MGVRHRKLIQLINWRTKVIAYEYSRLTIFELEG